MATFQRRSGISGIFIEERGGRGGYSLIKAKGKMGGGGGKDLRVLFRVAMSRRQLRPKALKKAEI